MFPEIANGGSYCSAEGKGLVKAALSMPLEVSCSTCGERVTFKIELNNHGWSIVTDGSVYNTPDDIAALGENAKYFHFFSIEL